MRASAAGAGPSIRKRGRVKKAKQTGAYSAAGRFAENNHWPPCTYIIGIRRERYMPFKVDPNSRNSARFAAKSAKLDLQPFDAATAKFKTAADFAMAVLNDNDAPLAERIKLAIAMLPYPDLRAAELRPAGKKALAAAAARNLAETGGDDWGGDLACDASRAN